MLHEPPGQTRGPSRALIEERVLAMIGLKKKCCEGNLHRLDKPGFSMRDRHRSPFRPPDDSAHLRRWQCHVFRLNLEPRRGRASLQL